MVHMEKSLSQSVNMSTKLELLKLVKEPVALNESRYISVDKFFLYSTTDKIFFDDSYLLVTHFPDFPLWENGIAYFK